MIIAYTRVSTNEQTTMQQKKAINEYAIAHNMVVDKFISDEGISAYSKTFEAREGMLEVLELAEKGLISDLIIFETSRISRRYGESVGLFDKLTMKGIRIHSVTDNGVINAQEIDQLMLAFRSYMNQQSSKLTSERIKSKLSLMKEQGLYIGGSVLWGFKVEDGRVVPNEEMKDMVINFFNDYISYGSKYVMNKYNINNKMTVNKRIKNDDYIQIIGEELFTYANKIRIDRTCRKDYTAKTNRSKQLFEGLLQHNCGKKLYLSNQNDGKYYRCYNCKESNRKTFKADMLEKNIESEISTIFDKLSYEKLEKHYLLKIEKLKLVLELEIKSIDIEIKETEKAIIKANDRLTSFILDGANDTLIKNISNIIDSKKSELFQLQQQLQNKELRYNDINNEIDTQLQQINNILNAKDIYTNATIEQKKSILHLIVKQITVTDYGIVDIFLNI